MSAKLTPSENLTQIFARNLRSIRKEQGISQGDLTRLAGLSARYVGKLERCETSPTLNTVEALADALSVEPVRLIGDENEGTRI